MRDRRLEMREVVEILDGYRKAIESSVFELAGYVIKNRENLDLDEVRLRCEYISNQINKFKNTISRAENAVRELKKEVGGGQEAV